MGLSEAIDTADYHSIFVNHTPLMDTRAPVEYMKGALPCAQNLPLMDDEERRQVGTCYKEYGQDAAIALGHQLVSGDSKASRMAAWVQFAQTHPQGYLYCFRGGLRSQTVQHWLKSEAGITYPRILGGYKAVRQFLLDTIDQALEQCHFIRLGGLTGTGKTDILVQLEHGLDLEGYAHHRGSGFGKHATPQPSQIDFEHRLAIDLLQKRAQGWSLFVVENESRTIGHCAIPPALYDKMPSYPLVLLEDSLENRVNRICQDYIVGLKMEFCTLYGEESGYLLFAQRTQQNLDNLVNRLGRERHQRLSQMMQKALMTQQHTGDVQAHHLWIKDLIVEYYDPMYAYAQQKKPQAVIFKGDHKAVLEYLTDHTNKKH